MLKKQFGNNSNMIALILTGAPLALVERNKLAEENYQTASDSLLKRYDKKMIIAFAHLQALDEAPFVNNPKHHTDLTNLLDIFSQNLAALENLNYPVKEWDFLLFYMFAKHLDEDTLTRFQLEELDNENVPTFEALIKFVTKQCDAKDTTKLSLQPNTNKLKGNSSTFFKSGNKQQASAFFCHQVDKIPCSLCNGDHFLYQCSNFREKSPQERFNFVKQNNLCTNCLSSQHNTKRCKSKSNCRECNLRHHTLLHLTRENKDNNNCFASCTNVASSSKNSDGPNLHENSTTAATASTSQGNNFCGIMSSTTNVLLSTAVVEILDIRDMPTTFLNYKSWSHIVNINLADPQFYHPGAIDIILGADVFPNILLQGRIAGKAGEPTTINTVFGRILMGTVQSNTYLNTNTTSLFAHTADTDLSFLDSSIKRFWELEEVPTYKSVSPDDELCETIFKNTHFRTKTGRYVVELPFKLSEPQFDFDASRSLALRRFTSLEKRLLKTPDVYKKYSAYIQELHSVAFTSDIKGMFTQILVTEKHRNYQRILWRFSPDESISDFRLKRVTFGLSCSPYLANRTIIQLAKDEGLKFPLAADVLQNDIYVDDIVTGCNSLNEAITIRDQLINLLKLGGFELRKWASNSAELLCDLPESEVQQQTLSFDDDSAGSIKVLGLQWRPTSDIFCYKPDIIEHKCTKRIILSDIARIFDPLGFLTPITFFAKHFIQMLWRLYCADLTLSLVRGQEGDRSSNCTLLPLIRRLHTRVGAPYSFSSLAKVTWGLETTVRLCVIPVATST
ncbi:hypothetical protein NQ315_011334 [Exocentrus adspersus]|uniref:Reverse transcriptase domain-containing protein n=1 Tax=Exocentrus adspersus TaxID=1586481 RepID=A0AAV8VKC7_9CUCU|nr:hypothetical protein NQ315_011334 [Exocentrus adspersus]